MNLPKNLVLKAEEIEELKRQNQLLIRQNQLLSEQNQYLAKEFDRRSHNLKIELLDIQIFLQNLNLSRFTNLLLLWLLQKSLMEQKYLTEPFLKADIEKNLKEMKQTREKIQKLQNQKTALLQSK